MAFAHSFPIDGAKPQDDDVSNKYPSPFPPEVAKPPFAHLAARRTGAGWTSHADAPSPMPAAEPKNSPRLSAAFPPPTIDGERWGQRVLKCCQRARRFVYSPRSCRLDGLALKRTQGQTNTRHYRIPSTLFFLRIGEIKAVDRAEGTARKIAAAVKNNSISLRGYGEERPGYPHIVQRSAVHTQIVPQVSCWVLSLIVRARVN